MNKQAVLQHSGMLQDTSKSKHNNQYYFEGRNIRITSTNSSVTGAIANNKGNEFLLEIPTPTIDFNNKIISYLDKTLLYTTNEINTHYENVSDFGTQTIIANGKTKNGFIIFSTNNDGFDCIWYLNDDDFNLKLLYVRDLKFNEKYPIQILNNYENSKIDKIYWVDGKEQLKFLNIHHSIKNEDIEELIDLSSTSISITNEVDLDSPKIDEILYGGTHTAGSIQYAYSYYKINGSQSTMSPSSILIPLGKSVEEGGVVNEIVGSIPKIVLTSLDDRFTNIRLYSIKYTSYNQLPSISLIADRNILGLDDFTYYDDGKIIQDITLEEFIFLSGKLIIPKHIESKDNKLFLFNYKDRIYNLDLKNNNIDFRAYSFPENSADTVIYKNISTYDENTSTPTGGFVNINYTTHIVNQTFLDEKNACINGYYHSHRFQPNSSIIGGEGPFIKYEITRSNKNKTNIYDYKFLKDDELYRIAIQLYNKYGIKSRPKWIADFITSSSNSDISNLNGNYAGIKITLKPEFYIWLNTQSNFIDENGEYDEFLKPVGFKLLRAERTLSDRTIISQGLINGMISQSLLTGYPNDSEIIIERANSGLKLPSFMRRFDNYLCPMYGNETYSRLDGRTNHPQWNGAVWDASEEIYSSSERRNSVYQYNQLMQFYSPDLLFSFINNIEANKIKVVGSLDNNFNSIKARNERWSSGEFGRFNIYKNSISPHDLKSQSYISIFSANEISRRGMVGPSYIHEDSERKVVVTYQYFRDYTGKFRKNTNPNLYEIYGKPEIAEFNQQSKKYNNDSDLIYTNTLTPLITDEAGVDDNNKTDHTSITSVLSHGARSAIFALGDDVLDTKDRLRIEDLFDSSSMKAEIPGEIGGIKNRVRLDKVISFTSDLVGLDFANQIIGVLETGAIFTNNDSSNVTTYIDFLDVKYTFDDISQYETFRSSLTVDDLGIKIAIVDHVDNFIYTIDDILLPNYDGLGIVSGEIFDFLEDNPDTIKYYVTYKSELDILSDDLLNPLPYGYIAAVTSTGNIYEWTQSIFSDYWNKIGSYLVSNDYKGGVGLICEFVNDEKLKYIGNYYGGNSYESKTKTIYVESGDYFKLNNNNIFNIVDPGDTFVQEYNIARISKSEAEPTSNNLLRITEVVSVRLESTVNQNKRSDESHNNWDSWFSPSQKDFHSYNRVYSQDSNLIKSQDISYELKINELYDTGILASQLKRPGETIDNWTNLAINDQMYLEGKYGSINGVIKHNDAIITFQDTAIANISINPRVQVQGSDGVGIELGTGTTLHDYTYVSTNSGTLNKWGIVSANSGIYYYDTINNSIYTVSNQVVKLTDIKGLHSYFQNNINNNLIKHDNHLLKTGIQIGYDYLNNDIYFTFQQLDNSDTISFNEFRNEFTSLHDFTPSLYFIKGDKFITTNPTNNELFNHNDNIYNKYYGKHFPSYIIYNINPEPYKDCIFDNINFKSEVYLNGQDEVNNTLTDIQAYNEYQDSSLIPLVNGRNGNLRRRFRDWNADIPRDGRTRIRSPWIKLKLQFDNENNKSIILHDMIVDYTT